MHLLPLSLTHTHAHQNHILPAPALGHTLGIQAVRFDNEPIGFSKAPLTGSQLQHLLQYGHLGIRGMAAKDKVER